MAEVHDQLRSRLRKACLKKGAAVFGIASVADADTLPRIRLAPAVRSLMGTKSLYTKRLTTVMPEAKSIVVIGVQSTDDWCELAVRDERGEYDWPGYMPLYWLRRDAAQLLREEGYRAAIPYEVTAPNSLKRIFSLAGIGAFGKNSLIISPKHGPWLRFTCLVTDAELEPDKPFDEDLCGNCSLCVKACPAKALKPYVVDPERCLVGVHIRPRIPKGSRTLLEKYEPQLTPVTHVMCTRCQMACPYTSAQRRKNVIPKCHRAKLD